MSLTVAPASVAPGQPISVAFGFLKPKTGFIAVLPAGVPPIFSASVDNWLQYVTQLGMVAHADLSGTTGTVTLNAPQQPGSYQVQAIVPADGGAAGSPQSVAFTVESHGTNPVGGHAGGPGFDLAALVQGKTLGVPNVLIAGGIAFLLLRK